MSSELAITTSGLGKEYVIRHEDPRQRTLVETIGGLMSSPVRRLRELGGRGAQQERFWALRDVDIEIDEGEIVGVIGKNGAGKSTLLKILSRITRPTTGHADVRGSVRSLLEVGIGFHPELTGRENIYLNGAILGMKRNEITRRFGEIVEFAEVERFLDTPVKRYSSGMYVRLAFAVAAHLEPDILLVDEVLAVGDATFQRRCIEKIGAMARSGRTVMIVSHNLQTIRSLTSRCILVDEGTIRHDGPTDDVIDRYVEISSEDSQRDLRSRADRTGSGVVRFTDVSIGSSGMSAGVVASGHDLDLTLRFETSRPARHVHVTVHITGALGERLSTLSTYLTGSEIDALPAAGSIRCAIPRLPLAPGHYHLELVCAVDELLADWVQNAAVLIVERGDFFRSGVEAEHGIGRMLMDQEWSVQAEESGR